MKKSTFKKIISTLTAIEFFLTLFICTDQTPTNSTKIILAILIIALGIDACLLYKLD